MKMEMQMKTNWTRAETRVSQLKINARPTRHKQRTNRQNVNGNWQSASGILSQKLSIRSVRCKWNFPQFQQSEMSRNHEGIPNLAYTDRRLRNIFANVTATCSEFCTICHAQRLFGDLCTLYKCERGYFG